MQDYQEIPQITDFLGNPRFPKSPTRDTGKGSGETSPPGGQVPPLGWSRPVPMELEHPKTPVFLSQLWASSSGPAAALEAVVEMGTAKRVAQEADSEKELNLASLNHPAEEMAAL